MDSIKKEIYVGRQLFIKGHDHPVTVVDLDNSAFIVNDFKNIMFDFKFDEIGRVIFLSKEHQAKTFKNTIEYIDYVLENKSRISKTNNIDINEKTKSFVHCASFEIDCWGKDQICNSFDYKYTPSPEEKKRWASSNTGPWEPGEHSNFTW